MDINEKDVWIVIAAYNESSVISQVLREISKYSYRVLVVDDGSTDDTVRQALQFPITVLHHPVNLGQGAALQTGIEYALQFPDTKILVTFDADGQHSADDIPGLLEPLQAGYEVVLGSRFIKGGSARNIPKHRKIILELAILFTRFSTGLNLTDTHNGLRAFSVDAARRIKITQNRMAHATEILAQISRYKLKYCEVPVTINYSPYSLFKGQSVWNTINILWELLSERLK